MLNDTRITFVGNLVKDPELRFTPSGAAVCKFTLAATPRVRNGEEWEDGETSFLDCTAWRNLAEHIAETLGRGLRVIVVGRLKTERWETKPDDQGKGGGEKRSRWVLDVDECGMSLQYATAHVRRATRNAPPADNEWASATPERPATVDGFGTPDAAAALAPADAF
jgi:single-strand DNA-binding protein